MNRNWRSDEYKQFIREKPCLNCGSEPCVPHHEGLGKGGVSCKAPDSHTLPLCAVCHDQLGKAGTKTFWKSVDTKMVIIEYLTEFIRGKLWEGENEHKRA